MTQLVAVTPRKTKKRIQELRKNQAEQDKIILEQLVHRGIVPKIL